MGTPLVELTLTNNEEYICYSIYSYLLSLKMRVLKPMWLKMQHISMRMFSIIIVLPLDIKWVRKLNILPEIYQHFSASKCCWNEAKTLF